MGKYKVTISGINTSDLVVLGSEEMKKLFIRMNDGDLFARDLLIEGNLRLVLSILKKFYNKKEGVLNEKICGCIPCDYRIINYCWNSNLLFIL